jgi:hypothetical protein
VRLQLAGGGSPFVIAKEIIAKEGFLKLYTGLSAGVLRQITYTSSRLGIFKCVPRLARTQAVTSAGCGGCSRARGVAVMRARKASAEGSDACGAARCLRS